MRGWVCLACPIRHVRSQAAPSRTTSTARTLGSVCPDGAKDAPARVSTVAMDQMSGEARKAMGSITRLMGNLAADLVP